MNLLTKQTPWVVASLLAGASIFGSTSQNQSQDSCQRPQVKCTPQPKCVRPLQEPLVPTVCAYNAPGEINVGTEGDWDYFVSASFVYWQPLQDNMSIAGIDTASTTNPYTPGGVSYSYLNLNCDYYPGFKVGLGMNITNDAWDMYSEYTRVHGNTSVSSGPASSGPSSGGIYSVWGDFFPAFGQTQEFQYVSANFLTNFDFIDLELGRKHYVGTSLLFRPAFGLRAAWILEKLNVNYSNYSAGGLLFKGNTHSWAIGPRVGLGMDWLLSTCGWRVFGNSYGDILFTKYTLKDKSQSLDTTSTYSLCSLVSSDSQHLLRTHLDLELGLGWGTYFSNNNWHVDLSAAWEFQVFFSQCMFRDYETGLVVTNMVQNGDLYVQGLTVTARLDF